MRGGIFEMVAMSPFAGIQFLNATPIRGDHHQFALAGAYRRLSGQVHKPAFAKPF